MRRRRKLKMHQRGFESLSQRVGNSRRRKLEVPQRDFESLSHRSGKSRRRKLEVPQRGFESLSHRGVTSRRRKLEVPQPVEAIHLIHSENFSAIAEYTAKLALLGNHSHINIISGKRLHRPRLLKKISKPRLWFVPDEREQNLKTIGRPTRGLSPPLRSLLKKNSCQILPITLSF